MITHDFKLNFKTPEGGSLHCPDYLEAYSSNPPPLHTANVEVII